MLRLRYAPEMGFLVEGELDGYIIKSNFMSKSLIFRSIFMGIMSVVVLSMIATPQTIFAETKNEKGDVGHTLIHNGKLTICKLDKKAYEVVREIKAQLTAYTNTVDQTDSTPNITASGFDLRTLKPGEGVVANNYLPFGTKVRIPELFGDMIFTVQDTGSPIHFDSVRRFDVYIPGGEQARKKAMELGRRTAMLEIVES